MNANTLQKTASRTLHRLAQARSRTARLMTRGTATRDGDPAMTQGMASANPGNVTEEQVRLRLQGLQHEVERSATLARWLGWLAMLLVALLIALIISIYLYYVMQYASVTSVERDRHRRATRGGRDCVRARVLGQDRVRSRKRRLCPDLDRIRGLTPPPASQKGNSPGRGRKTKSRPSA